VGSTHSPDGNVVKMHSSVDLTTFRGAAAKIQLRSRLTRSLRRASDILTIQFVSVDVDFGSFFWTPTELKVVPSVWVKDAAHRHFCLPRICRRGDGEYEISIVVLDINSLATSLSLATGGDEVRAILERLVESKPYHD